MFLQCESIFAIMYNITGSFFLFFIESRWEYQNKFWSYYYICAKIAMFAKIFYLITLCKYNFYLQCLLTYWNNYKKININLQGTGFIDVMPISELESNIEHIVNEIDRELQSLMCIFQRLTIWKKKKKRNDDKKRFGVTGFSFLFPE